MSYATGTYCKVTAQNATLNAGIFSPNGDFAPHNSGRLTAVCFYFLFAPSFLLTSLLPRDKRRKKLTDKQIHQRIMMELANSFT